MPRYEFECPVGHYSTEFLALSDWRAKLKIPCQECQRPARQIISVPCIQTLASFSRDIDDAEVRATRNPGDGSYLDPTLSYHPDTGAVIAPITSERQRQKLMAERGLFEKPPSDKAKDVARLKRTKPVHFI